jgi:hypothetical protein
MTFEIGLEMGHPSNSKKKYVAKFAKMLKAWNFKVSYVQTRPYERVHQERRSLPYSNMANWEIPELAMELSMGKVSWIFQLAMFDYWMVPLKILCEWWFECYVHICSSYFKCECPLSEILRGHCNHQSDNQSFCRFLNCTYI